MMGMIGMIDLLFFFWALLICLLAFLFLFFLGGVGGDGKTSLSVPRNVQLLNILLGILCYYDFSMWSLAWFSVFFLSSFHCC